MYHGVDICVQCRFTSSYNHVQAIDRTPGVRLTVLPLLRRFWRKTRRAPLDKIGVQECAPRDRHGHMGADRGGIAGHDVGRPYTVLYACSSFISSFNHDPHPNIDRAWLFQI